MSAYTPPSSPSITLNLAGSYNPPASPNVDLNLTNNVRTFIISSSSFEVSTNLNNLTYIRYIVFPVNTITTYTIVITSDIKYYKRIPISSSSFTLTRNDITFPRTYIHYISSKDINVTQYEFFFLYPYWILPTSTSFSTTLNDITIFKQNILTLDNIHYTLSLNSVNLVPYRSLFLDNKSLNYFTNNVDLLHNSHFTLSSSSYSLSFHSPPLVKPRLSHLILDSLSFSLSISPTKIDLYRTFPISSTEFSYSFEDINYKHGYTIKIKRDLPFKSSTYTLSLRDYRNISIQTDNYSLSTQDVSYKKDSRIQLEKIDLSVNIDGFIRTNRLLSIINSSLSSTFSSIDMNRVATLPIRSMSIAVTIGEMVPKIYRGTEDVNRNFLINSFDGFKVVQSYNRIYINSLDSFIILNPNNKIVVNGISKSLEVVPSIKHFVSTNPKHVIKEINGYLK